jgi:hypothetical protein
MSILSRRPIQRGRQIKKAMELCPLCREAFYLVQGLDSLANCEEDDRFTFYAFIKAFAKAEKRLERRVNVVIGGVK